MRRSERSTDPSEALRPLPPAGDIVAEYSTYDVNAHPLFRELAIGPVDLRTLWLLMANLRVGISRNFVPWLATTIARVDDRRIGALVSKQLYDELGCGDFEHIHSTLLDRFVHALARWRFRGQDEAALLAPGRDMGMAMGALFTAPHAYEAVGALIVGEIFAEKMDRCVGDEVRRQNALTSDELKWLAMHEILEANHAGDSNALASLVPNDAPTLTATWRGANAQWSLLWRFLDDVHELAQRCRSMEQTRPS